MEKNRIILDCECGTHLLQVIHVEEFLNSGKYESFEFSMFSYGQYPSGKLSFFEKIRIIFEFLKTGKMHSDQLIFTKEETTSLYNFLKTQLKK